MYDVSFAEEKLRRMERQSENRNQNCNYKLISDLNANTENNEIHKTIVAILIFIVLCVFLIGGGLIYKHNNNSASVESGDTLRYSESAHETQDWSVEANLDTLKNLNPDIWNKLCYQDKREILCVVKNIELYYFGIPTDEYIELSVEDLNGDIVGEYSHFERKIRIDYNHLMNDSAESVLDTVCHEARHCYQHMCADLYNMTDDEYKNLAIFNNTKKYVENFNSYVYAESEADEQFYDYYCQHSEEDAREYAEQTVNYYYEVIESYGI